jgi:predicted nucleic acid-binding protein
LSDIALDTNILVYFAGIIHSGDDRQKIGTITELMARLDSEDRIVIPTQILGECYNVFTRSGQSREDALLLIEGFSLRYPIIGCRPETMMEALKLATQHRLQIWDALILASASEAGCRVLLSEDMQDGFQWRSIEVLNPLADRTERLLFG